MTMTNDERAATLTVRESAADTLEALRTMLTTLEGLGNVNHIRTPLQEAVANLEAVASHGKLSLMHGAAVCRMSEGREFPFRLEATRAGRWHVRTLAPFGVPMRLAEAPPDAVKLYFTSGVTVRFPLTRDRYADIDSDACQTFTFDLPG